MGCSSDGAESVKADEGALEAASIVAPAIAAIAPREECAKPWFPPGFRRRQDYDLIV